MPLFTRRRCTLALGAILLAATPVWRATGARRWTDRIPPGWSAEERFAGVQVYADSITGILPDRDDLGIYTRRLRVADERGRPDSIRLHNETSIYDPATGRVTWQYITQELVDPRTGARLEPANRGRYAVFPREVQRGVYRLSSNYLKDIPVRFEREDVVAGLNTWMFAYRGPAEFGDSYVGTKEYPGIKLAAGQEIRCVDDQFYVRLWIEPRTGEVVKVEEGCPSRDVVYDVPTGRTLQAIDRWSGLAAGNGLLSRVQDVQRARLKYLLLGVGSTWMLGLAGAALLAAGALMTPRAARL